MMMKQKCWRMCILFSVACFQINMCNSQPTGNSLVSCTACQAVKVQNFACDVNCQVVKGKKDDNIEVTGVLDEMMQKINQLNESMSQEKEKVKKLEDDNRELMEKLNQLNETLNQEKEIITELRDYHRDYKGWKDAAISPLHQVCLLPADSRCAFAVQGSGAEKDIDSSPIVFENLNTCNGYDVTTGVFNATIAGTYMLNAHVVARTNYGYFRIRKNDDVICDAWVEDDGGDVTSCTTVTHLELGEKVKVTGDDGNAARISGDRRGFSGILIYPD